jgi:hypothetical protein
MRRLLPLLVVLLAAGCANNRIEATDGGVFLPMGRISANLTGGPAAPSEPQAGHAIEFGVTGGSGDDTQRISSTPIVFGGQTFAAPVDLRHEFDFRYAEVAWRWRKFFGAGGFGFGSGDETGVRGASRLEAYIVQPLGRNAALRAGYAAWSVVSERENASDIHVFF